MKYARMAVVLGILGLVLSGTAHASYIYFDYSQDNLNNSGSSYDAGSQFTVGATPAVMTEVGQWYTVRESATLLFSSKVELWSLANHSTPVMTWTIPAGTTLSPDQFAWMSITPYALSANTTYILTSWWQGDFNSLPLYGNFPAPGSGITYDARVYNSSQTDAYPDTFGVARSNVDMGPSFQYELTIIPEPGTLALLGLGGIVLLIRRKVVALAERH